MSELMKKGPATYILPQDRRDEVPGLVIATEELLQEMEIESRSNRCAMWPIFQALSVTASPCPIFIGAMAFQSEGLRRWMPKQA